MTRKGTVGVVLCFALLGADHVVAGGGAGSTQTLSGGGSFGAIIAMSEERLLVTAYTDGTGTANVFVNNGGVWEPEGVTLVPSKIVDAFGRGAADIDGDVAAINSPLPFADQNIFVYRFDGVDWAEEQILPVLGLTVDHPAIAVDGDLIFAGASGALSDVGNVRIFEWDGNSWSQISVLAAPAESEGRFGWSLDVSDDTLIVCANPNGGVSKCFLYPRLPNGLPDAASPTVVESGHGVNSEFGIASVVIGDLAFVGDTSVSASGGAGSVYVFRRTAGVWNTTPFELAGTDFGGQFGKSFAYRLGRLAVGAPFNASGAGVVTLYKENGGSWSVEDMLMGQSGGAFGYSVALSGPNIACGAPVAQEVEVMNLGIPVPAASFWGLMAFALLVVTFGTIRLKFPQVLGLPALPTSA